MFGQEVCMHSLKTHKYRQICHNTKIYSPKPLVEKKNSGCIRVTGELIKKKKKMPTENKKCTVFIAKPK